MLQKGHDGLWAWIVGSLDFGAAWAGGGWGNAKWTWVAALPFRTSQRLFLEVQHFC